MSSNLSDVVLDAPTEDPAIDVDASFTMTIYGVYGGAGDASVHSLYLEWDQGTDTWQAIPESSQSAGLYTDGTSSYIDTIVVYDSGNPISINVYGDAAGTFKIRAHGYRGGSDYYDPDADPWFTVTVGGGGGAEQTLDENETNLKLDGSNHPGLEADYRIDGIETNLKLDGSDHPSLSIGHIIAIQNANQALDGYDHPANEVIKNLNANSINHVLDGSVHSILELSKNLNLINAIIAISGTHPEITAEGAIILTMLDSLFGLSGINHPQSYGDRYLQFPIIT